MKNSVKSLALIAFGLLLTSASRAETLSAITTLTCTRSNNTTITAHVYAYDFSSDESPNFFFSMYTYGSNFDEFTSEKYFGSGTYSSCKFANMADVADNVTIESVSTYGVGANVGAGPVAEDPISQTYTLVTFSFSDLSVGSVGARDVRAGSPSTPEQKAHALEVFKASIPPLLKH